MVETHHFVLVIRISFHWMFGTKRFLNEFYVRTVWELVPQHHLLFLGRNTQQRQHKIHIHLHSQRVTEIKVIKVTYKISGRVECVFTVFVSGK